MPAPNNVGGLGQLDQFSIYASYEILYNLVDLSNQSMGLILPLSLGNLGFDVNRLGGELYDEMSAGLSYSNQFGLASLGLKINYFQMLIEGLEKQSTLILEFGGIAEITPRWFFGAHIYNLTQARIADGVGYIPTVVKAGLSYRPFQTLSLNLEVLKDIDFEPTVRLGLEYEAFRFFRLRTGFNDQPFKAFGGFGFHKNRLSIDYSYGTHQQLGGSSQISVSYHSSPKTDDD